MLLHVVSQRHDGTHSCQQLFAVERFSADAINDGNRLLQPVVKLLLLLQRTMGHRDKCKIEDL